MKKNTNLSREFNINSFGGWEYAAPEEGFASKPKLMELMPGTRIDRFGDENGRFVSPHGIPFENRSLPRGTERLPYHVYKVISKITVLSGSAAPAFNMEGGAIQYQLPDSVLTLIKCGKLVREKGEFTLIRV